MQLIFKLLISLCIIAFCTIIGRRFPSLGGLIATMPLTSLLILIWIYTENKSSFKLLQAYTYGALWGIIPTILFFLSAYLCLKKQLPFLITMSISASVWIAGACIHQWLLR